MKGTRLSHENKMPLAIGGIVFFLILLLTQYLAFQRYQIDSESRKKEIVKELTTVKEHIQSNIANSLSATKTLAFIVETYGTPSDFEKLAKQILESNPNVDALELTQGGVITHVYPFEENKSVIGYNILNDSLRNKEAFKAIEKRQLYFDGPIKLIQGGVGFVGRLPIFIKNKFWGFSVVLIKRATFLEAAFIGKSESSPFTYQLSKTNKQSGKEELLFSDETKSNNDQSVSTNLKDGEWRLTVSSKENAVFLNASIISFFGVTLATICGLFAGYITKRPTVLKKLVQKKTKELEASEIYYRSLIEKSADAIVLLNDKGKTIYQTPSTKKISGYTLEEMQSLSNIDLVHPDFREGHLFVFNYALNNPGVSIRRNDKIKHKDGHFIFVEGTFTNLLKDAHIKAIIYNYYDVSERVASDEKAKTANRLYEVTSLVNRAMINITDEKKLYTEICQIAVSYGKFKMAWIGLIDANEQKIIPLTFAGEENGYLTKIQCITLDAEKSSLGPTGSSLKSGNYAFCNDIKNDPLMKPWAQEALSRGYHSSIALPIKKYGNVIGAFSLYAPVVDYFNQNEIRLLEEMTADLTFTIENLENEKLLKEAEAEVIKTYKDKETTLNRINDGVVSVDNNWRYTFLNEAALREHPTGKNATLGKIIWDVHPEMQGTAFWDKCHEAMREKKIVEFESFYEEMQLWFFVKVYPSADGLTIYYTNISERKKVEQEFIAEKNLSESIINSLPGIFYFYEKSGKFIRWNTNFEKLSGFTSQEIKQLHPLDFYEGEEKKILKEKIDSVFVNGQDHVEAHFLTKAKKKIPYYFTGHSVAFNNKEYLIGMGLDISSRKKIESELKENETRLADAQAVAKLGSWETNMVTNNVIWSDETYRIFELNPDDFKSSHADFLNYVHPDDKERVNEAFVASAKNSTINTIEHRIITPSGKQKFVEERWRIFHSDKGLPIKAQGTCQDITARKKAEELIKESQSELRKLYTYLQTVREDERTGIAREIHDELGQQLTVLKMDLFWIIKKLNPNELVLIEKSNGMVRLIDDTIKTVRRIASELRPGILDDLGLVAAIEWQGQEFEKRIGITTQFRNLTTHVNPGRDAATHIFRVYQESLTNVARHAKAKHVETVLEEKDGYFTLTIIDDGVGFNKEEARTKNSLGILGMRERALLFEGELQVESMAVKGTRVTLKIPEVNLGKKL